MQKKFGTEARQAPIRPGASTTGRLATSRARIASSASNETPAPAKSATLPDRSRTWPSPSRRPGFSCPGAPNLNNFIWVLLLPASPWRRRRLPFRSHRGCLLPDARGDCLSHRASPWDRGPEARRRCARAGTPRARGCAAGWRRGSAHATAAPERCSGSRPARSLCDARAMAMWKDMSISNMSSGSVSSNFSAMTATMSAMREISASVAFLHASSADSSSSAIRTSA